MTTIELKNYPDIKRILERAISYRKHKAFLSEFHEVSINSYWDGGSRSTFVLYNLETGQRHALPTSTHPYYDVAARGIVNTGNAAVEVDSRGNVTLKQLPENCILIEAGTFCGKPATAHLFVNAANMPKQLEASHV